MPASIAHMLISRTARKNLHEHADPALQEFLAQVLDKYPAFMELGSLGPDLPYYGSLLKACGMLS